MSMVHFGGSYGALLPGIGIVEKDEAWRADGELIAAAAAQKTKRWRLTRDDLDAMLRPFEHLDRRKVDGTMP